MGDVVKKQWGVGFLWIVILLLAAGMGFIAREVNMLKAENQWTAVVSTVEAQSKELASLTEAVKRHDEQFQQVTDDSNKLAEGLKSVDRTLREGNAQWRYMQIQFYLERAAQEAFVMKDPMAAKGWLEAALHDVGLLNQPNLLPVQEAIQQDIQDLSQNGGTAISQAMTSLSVLSDSISTLPHKQAPEKMTTEATPASTTDNQGWRTWMKAGWADLKSLVRVRTVEGEVVPYFSKSENAVIDANVSLILSEASFSAMRAQEKLYHQEVTQALVWLNRYYDTTVPAVQEALNTLTHLSTLHVAFTPPSRLKSFDAWNAFVSQSRGNPA